MKSQLEQSIVSNLSKLLELSHLTKRELALRTGIDESSLGKILNGKQGLSFSQLENISNSLGMHYLDVITYPVKYVPSESQERERVTLMVEFTKDNKDKLFQFINQKIY